MSEKEDLQLLKNTFEDFIKTSAELQNSYEELKLESVKLSQFLSNILDNIKSSIFVIDNEMKLILWNKLAVELFPVLVKLTPPIDISLINKKSYIDLIQIIEDEREIMEVEVDILNSTKWFEIQSTSFININKEKIGHIVLISDKTELKQLQIKSRQEDRLRVMGELAAEVAHEIRNPLGSIELMVSLLDEDLEDDSKHGGILKRIRSAVNNMNHTVTNILLYTKDIKLKKVNFELLKLFEEAKNMALMTIVKNKIDLQFETDDIILNGDFELLKQSLGNILLNAAEASEAEGKILIKAVEEGDYVVISIKDEGKGIPSDIMDKIFNPFFTTKNTGTGLGLAMVKRIIEAHKGIIDVKSDMGTLFILKIPIK